ncbi:MAG: tandem-95 repeat protein, partial [Candidatus Magnetomorum sp.]|nr:tandem-95 repeat protein [Candidatus Magnetomorum sp.]
MNIKQFQRQLYSIPTSQIKQIHLFNLILGLMLFFLLISHTPLFADIYENPVLELPENIQILPGSSVSIPLTLNNPENILIYGLETSIIYDPAILKATGLTLTGTVLENDYIIVHNDQNNGQIIICYAANATVYDGEGCIGYLNFDVIGEQGESSSLTFVTAKQNETTVPAKNGSLTVQMNQPPSISTIATVNTNEDAAISVSFTIDDLESPPCSLTIDVTSSNTDMIPQDNIFFTCDNNDYSLDIYPEANKNGVSTIEIKATDSLGLFDIQTFDIQVFAVNDPPVINIIANQTIDEDTSTHEINFTISDIETSASSLILSANSSNTNLLPMDHIVFGGSEENRTIVITPVENLNGNALLTITVSDGELTDSTLFELIVTPVDDSPYVLSEIENQSLVEDASETIIPLTNVFADIDNDISAIIKTVFSNSNETLLNASINGNTLTLSLNEEKSGTAILSIMATSNGLTVVDTFTVDVNAEDDPPEVAMPLQDITLDEDAAETTRNLSGIFTDVDNDDTAIVKTILANSHPSLVSLTISGNILTVFCLPDQNGTAEISIQATSNGLTVVNSFTVTVTAVDDAPILTNEIEDSVVNENAADTIIPLTAVFTDIENDTIIKTIENNTNESLVSATIIDNILTLKYQPNQSGMAVITVRGTANGLFEEDTFRVTVISENSPPEVVRPIADVTVDINAPGMSIPLTGVFFDPEDDLISISIQNNTHTELVVATLSGNDLIVSFQPDLEGEAEITIRATASGKTVDDVFTIYVSSTDVGPEVANPIADFIIDEDSSDTSIDLSPVFTDPDNDDLSIVKTFISNSNESLVSVLINDNQLILSYAANMSGESTVVIRATSRGKTIDDTFTIIVVPIDDPPVIQNPIDSMTSTEDAADQSIPLTGLFTDPDTDDALILATVMNNSNSGLLSATISNNVLMLNYLPNQFGTTEITIRGTSNGLFVDYTFSITVNAIDDPPVVANPIGDLTMDATAESLVIDLTSVFTDIDNDDTLIIKTIEDNTNPSLVSASITGNNLLLTHPTGMEGETHITVQATCNGLTAIDSFSVFIDSSDSAPIVAIPIEDITIAEGATDTIIPLTPVFTDPDNDDLTIEKIILSNSNEQVVSAIIVTNRLILACLPNMNGVAIITIRGISKGQYVDDTFKMTVLPVDSPPAIIQPVQDVFVDEDAADISIPLPPVFTDVDNDDTAIIITIINNTNTSLITATIADSYLVLSCLPDQNGSAEISIQAQSNGLTVVDQMTIFVNAVDDPPVVGTLISTVTVDEDAEDTIIDLSTAFVDIDSSSIVKTIQTNTYPALVAANIENETLTLDYAANQSGSATIVILGMSNGKTVTQAFQVWVTSVNDAPVAFDSQIQGFEDTRIMAGIHSTDAENDPLTVIIITQPGHGQLTVIDFSTGDFVYEPYNNYNGMDSFTFKVSDHQLSSQTAQVNIFLTPVNDLQGMSELPDHTIYEGTTIKQSFAITDIDNPQLIITVSTSNPLLLPYNQFTFIGGQVINSQQIIVSMDTTEMPVTMSIKPASGLAGSASVTVSVIDDSGQEIEQSFTVSVKKYQIVATAIGQGKINPSGIVKINTGAPYVQFSMQPNTGYIIDYLNVDGTIMSARSMYTFWNVSENHAITAVFREPTLYTISSQAEIGGTLTPSGDVQVQDGMSQAFTIKANSGYMIDYLRVDGVYVAPTSQYTFSTVTAPHTIQAFFEAIPSPIAGFKASPVTGSPPLEVVFTDQSQNTVTSRIWNFGDNTSSIVQNPRHTYFSPGKYSVSLTVK